MKVLVLTMHRRGGFSNEPTCRNFFISGPTVMYGPGEPLSFIPFVRERPLQDVVAAAGAECVIVNMKKRVVGWLKPGEVAGLSIPTAIVEDDYHYEKSDEWYLRCAFDHVFFRGRRPALESALNGVWLPFSVNPEQVKPGDNRAVSVGFCNTIKPPHLYPVRNALLRMDLPGLVRRHKLSYLKFIEFYRSCLIGITCSSLLRGESPKHIVVPACGALLMTDGPRALHELLPDPAMYELYTLENVRQKIEQLMADPDGTRARGRLAAEYVLEHHSHARRWEQLLERVQS